MAVSSLNGRRAACLITGSTWELNTNPIKACDQTSGFRDDPISADAGRGEDRS